MHIEREMMHVVKAIQLTEAVHIYKYIIYTKVRGLITCKAIHIYIYTYIHSQKNAQQIYIYNYIYYIQYSAVFIRIYIYISYNFTVIVYSYVALNHVEAIGPAPQRRCQCSASALKPQKASGLAGKIPWDMEVSDGFWRKILGR